MLIPSIRLQSASAAHCGRGCSRDGSFNLATVVCENEKDKRLEKGKRQVLPFPFGCAIEDAGDEAEKAIREVVVEIGSIFMERSSSRLGIEK
jgi:hypothetical protein